MSDGAPKDLTIGQVVKDAGPLLKEAPAAIDAAIDQINKIISALMSAGLDPQVAQKINAIQIAIKNGAVQAEAGVAAVEALLHQFGIPLALAGGIKVQGSGQLAQLGEGGLKGLQTAMTEAQKYIAIATPLLQLLVLTAGTLIAMYPNVGLVGIGGGLTVAKVIGIAAGWLNVRYSKYPDAPRAQLVSLPKS